MNINKRLLNLISRYLDLNETDSQRKELFKWYDDLNNKTELKVPQIKASYSRSRNKLFSQISPNLENRRYKNLIWQSAAAIVIAAVSVSLVLNRFKEVSKYHPLDIAEANAITPPAQKTILTFSNGTRINPDTITINKKILVDKNLVLSKMGKGVLALKPIKMAPTSASGTIETFDATNYTLILTDGTKVDLNANSKLTFPEMFSTNDRLVSLKGEGYFEVTKTSNHSKFFVKTCEQVVKVLGTKFNIRSYNSKLVKTTLLEGSVSITPTNKSFYPVTIKPNQQAVLKNNGIQITKVDAPKALAWKDGFFVFDGDNTLEVLSEIAKWYGLELDVSNAAHLNEHSGRIPSNVNLGQLIELLNYSGVHVKVCKDDVGKRKLFII